MYVVQKLNQIENLLGRKFSYLVFNCRKLSYSNCFHCEWKQENINWIFMWFPRFIAIYNFIFLGYDGGLHTTYFVEVWETKNLIANVSTPLPAWILRGLGSGKTLKLVFYAFNARGRSEPATLRINTLARLALPTGII